MKWISIKDRWPEERQQVLIYCDDGDIAMGHWADYPDKIVWHIYLGNGNSHNITHWKPLPELPEKD